METKICNNCGKELPATTEYFHEKKTGKYGLRAVCKNCIKEYSKQWYEENKEQAKEQANQYYIENKKQRKKYRKQYYENNKEQFLYKQKQYYEENKERIFKVKRQQYEKNKEQIKNYRELNNEHIKEYMKRYREENRERSRQYYYKNKEIINKQRVQNEKEQIKTDIGYKLLKNCRNRLRQAIKGKNKSASTKKLIGCSIEYLLQHLESQFQEGMTWDNYGEWHIDHIKPCALFDFTKEEDQRECFNYKNLQPLWAEDNIRKSCNY